MGFLLSFFLKHLDKIVIVLLVAALAAVITPAVIVWRRHERNESQWRWRHERIEPQWRRRWQIEPQRR